MYEKGDKYQNNRPYFTYQNSWIEQTLCFPDHTFGGNPLNNLNPWEIFKGHHWLKLFVHLFVCLDGSSLWIPSYLVGYSLSQTVLELTAINLFFNKYWHLRYGLFYNPELSKNILILHSFWKVSGCFNERSNVYDLKSVLKTIYNIKIPFHK